MSLGEKLIGGSLSRERTVEKSTIRNEGGDIYWCQRRRDTRSNKKETDDIRDTANERLCVKCQCLSDWCGYDIQRVRDLFRDSADYEIQRTKHFCVQQKTCLALWCGDKETLADAKRLYPS